MSLNYCNKEEPLFCLESSPEWFWKTTPLSCCLSWRCDFPRPHPMTLCWFRYQTQTCFCMRIWHIWRCVCHQWIILQKFKNVSFKYYSTLSLLLLLLLCTLTKKCEWKCRAEVNVTLNNSEILWRLCRFVMMTWMFMIEKFFTNKNKALNWPRNLTWIR